MWLTEKQLIELDFVQELNIIVGYENKLNG